MSLPSAPRGPRFAVPEETRRFVAFTDSRRLFLSTSCPKSVTFVAASPGLVGRGTALKMLLGGEDFDRSVT